MLDRALGKPFIPAEAVPVAASVGTVPAVILVCDEGTAVGEGTLAACGAMVDVKLNAGLEVNDGAVFVELAAAWGSLTLTVDMTCRGGTLAATMPCADPVADVPAV